MQDERFGETTTIVVEPARISGSTAASSRRELTKRLRAERMLRWCCALLMAAFAVVWLVGMLLLAWFYSDGIVLSDWHQFGFLGICGSGSGAVSCLCGSPLIFFERKKKNMAASIADVAAEYIRAHRVERQSLQIRSDGLVELTVIQNLWADRSGHPRLGIDEAPVTVMRAIENSQRGHVLFDRVRESPGLVAYRLR